MAKEESLTEQELFTTVSHYANVSPTVNKSLVAIFGDLERSNVSRDELDKLMQWILSIEQSSISRSEFLELQSLVDCIAQSCVSPDNYNNLKELVHSLIETSASGDFVTEKCSEISEQVEQLKSKLESNIEMCNISTQIVAENVTIFKSEIISDFSHIKDIIESQNLQIQQLQHVLNCLMLASKLPQRFTGKKHIAR